MFNNRTKSGYGVFQLEGMVLTADQVVHVIGRIGSVGWAVIECARWAGEHTLVQ